MADLHLRQFGLEKLEALIGDNTYARKNLGFIIAKKMGVESIWEIDDDNFPVKDPFATLDDPSVLSISNDSTWVNMFDSIYATNQTGGWFRGFPIAEIRRTNSDPPKFYSADADLSTPNLIQFSVRGEPDVDAIFRMTRREYFSTQVEYWPNAEFDETSRKLFSLREGHLFPVNTQNTLWCDDFNWHFLYHPVQVSMRFSDILKTMVAQGSHRVGFGPTTVVQNRNPHRVFSDFEDEVSMHLNLPVVEEILKSEEKDIIGMYSLLFENDVVGPNEIEILSEFVSFLDS